MHIPEWDGGARYEEKGKKPENVVLTLLSLTLLKRYRKRIMGNERYDEWGDKNKRET